MNETDILIIRTLARVDAVWLPLRDRTRPRNGNTTIARQDYRAGQGVVHAAGGNSVDRTRASRVMADAVAAGLVTTIGSGARVNRVALSPSAEARARALVGLPGLPESIACAHRLHEYVDPGRYLIEPVLAGVQWGSENAKNAFMDLEDLLLPALVHGWVDARADCHGRVAYALSPAGISDMDFSERPDPGDAQISNEATDEYYTAMRSALAALGATEQNPSEIGRPCLPVSSMHYEPSRYGRLGVTPMGGEP